MNKSIIIAAIIAATAAHLAFATPSITGVTAQQRYPWNGKVDITYTISGDVAATAKQNGLIPSLKVSATDGMTGMSYVATSLSGDMTLTDGFHTIVWDMDAEGLNFISSNVVFSVSCEMTPATYCVIDLSAGANASSYPVTYLAEPPSGGFNVDEYKTMKLVLKRIEAGTFIMGENQSDESHRVILTKPFFIGLIAAYILNIPMRTIENRILPWCAKKLKVKKHRAIAYESSDKNIATVSKKGVIKARGKGTCKVFVYTQNGVSKAIKVTVK